MNDNYISPLSERYASKEMQYIFSQEKKFTTWRKLWITLAECQKDLGLNISEEQIDELKLFAEDINYDTAKIKEQELRHDVMAHIHAYGEQCPKAKGIIHLGATSCYVGDNTDIILMREGLELVRNRLISIIAVLSKFALEYKNMPTLGFTHFQSAQPTTVGKRASTWIYDLLLDLEQLEFALSTLKLRGVKGTTGTQASFMELFEGDEEKVKKLDKMVADKLGFKGSYPVTGQTYSRKVDSIILNVLSGIAQSAYKFSNDIRLLAHMKEIEEPFESTQVGSSAMAYKRNPMRSERIAALSRFVIVDAMNASLTTTGQWLERTLDDSANKRLSVPEAFLAVDGILSLYGNVSEGLVVYPKMIEKHLTDELPFMATENILMYCVKRGGDRQEIHESIRKHSIAASERIKNYGEPNDLVDRLAGDETIPMTKDEILETLKPEYFIGRAPGQVDEFLKNEVLPLLGKYSSDIGIKSEINV